MNKYYDSHDNQFAWAIHSIATLTSGTILHVPESVDCTLCKVVAGRRRKSGANYILVEHVKCLTLTPTHMLIVCNTGSYYTVVCKLMGIYFLGKATRSMH